MRLDVVADEHGLSVTMSDKDGYSPDKLDDWVSLAITLIVAAEQAKRDAAAK